MSSGSSTLPDLCSPLDEPEHADGDHEEHRPDEECGYEIDKLQVLDSDDPELRARARRAPGSSKAGRDDHAEPPHDPGTKATLPSCHDESPVSEIQRDECEGDEQERRAGHGPKIAWSRRRSRPSRRSSAPTAILGDAMDAVTPGLVTWIRAKGDDLLDEASGPC